MDLATFEDGLDRYGADLAVWPPEIRAAARALVERSAEAAATQRTLQEIEDLLRAERAVPSAVAAMASRAMRQRQDRPIRQAVQRAGWAMAALAALVLGLLVGGIGLDHPDNSDRVMAAAFDTMGAFDVD